MGRKAKQATPAPATATPPPPESTPPAPAPPVAAADPEKRGPGRPPGNPMPSRRAIRVRARKLLGLKGGDQVEATVMRLAEIAVELSCGASHSQRENLEAERKAIKEIIKLQREDQEDEGTEKLVKTAAEVKAAIERQRGGSAQRASMAPTLSTPDDPKTRPH